MCRLRSPGLSRVTALPRGPRGRSRELSRYGRTGGAAVRRKRRRRAERGGCVTPPGKGPAPRVARCGGARTGNASRSGEPTRLVLAGSCLSARPPQAGGQVLSFALSRPPVKHFGQQPQQAGCFEFRGVVAASYGSRSLTRQNRTRCQRSRNTMAIAFIASRKASRTMMPAAAFSANAACGRETQLKIWIGSTVKGDQMLFGTNGT